VSAEVVDNIPEGDLEAVRTKMLTSEALRVMQHKNPDGSYRLTAFREHSYDLFISYATEDLELCVHDFVQNLWRHGVTAVWWHRMTIDVRESIPKKVDEGLNRSAYIMCVLTADYYQKFWTRAELDAVTIQMKPIIPIWVDTDFKAVSAFSPTLASKKAIVYDGDAVAAMSIVADILHKDQNTQYFHGSESRVEEELYWAMVWIYVKNCLGVLERRYDRQFSAINSPENWKAHVEREARISRKQILAMAGEFPDYTPEEQAHLILAVLKRASDGWFPTYDLELELLRRARLSDW
jgi:hypothetical protein